MADIQMVSLRAEIPDGSVREYVAAESILNMYLEVVPIAGDIIYTNLQAFHVRQRIWSGTSAIILVVRPVP
jgi:hypothetical protein